uniref:Uncharacterized protein n=1 Tax=Stegastes partitus TaxID=144197 RepID=A0A3B5B4G8_9TELE
MGTNKCASQSGMTAYGTRRHLYDPKTQTDKPYDQTTISLQMGTNKGASQVKSPSSLSFTLTQYLFLNVINPYRIPKPTIMTNTTPYGLVHVHTAVAPCYARFSLSLHS